MDGNGGLLREYQYGQNLVSMKAPTSLYYFHRDGLGSVTNVTSSTGTAMWTYTYNPYVETRTETKNNNQAPTNFVKFAGQYLDATGLYHLRARQYDPTLGRFLAPDPVLASRSQPPGSTYVYARACPTRFVDPAGLESKPAGEDFDPGLCAAGTLGFLLSEAAGTVIIIGASLSKVVLLPCSE
jgi:RHS repeat-associated protein